MSTIKLSGTLRFTADNGFTSEFPIGKKNAITVPVEVFQCVQHAFMNQPAEPAVEETAQQVAEEVNTGATVDVPSAELFGSAEQPQ